MAHYRDVQSVAPRLVLVFRLLSSFKRHNEGYREIWLWNYWVWCLSPKSDWSFSWYFLTLFMVLINNPILWIRFFKTDSKNMWHSRRKSTFQWQKRRMSFLYQKIALTSFYPMVLVALQYPFVSLSYKRSRPRSYTAEERRNQAKKSRAMFPFTSVKHSRWSDHTHIIPGSHALRWEMS